MKFKRTLALLLCMVLMAGAFTGCGQTAEAPSVSDDGASTASPSAEASASPSALILRSKRFF